MKTLFTTKSILIAVVFTMFLAGKNYAATLYSTGASNWRWTSTTSWTYNSNGSGTCGCIPASGDIIIIRVTDSISVPTNVNVSGNVTVNVYGELNITGFLDLLGSGSVVNIYTGGQLTSNGSSSSKLRIGGTATAEYSGNDGDISGPWTISNGFSGPNMTLPVVLTSFSGSYKNTTIVLAWTTSQEVNNDHFEIQKSTDGKTFFSIGQLNSSNLNSYSFTDNEVSSSINYYRLLQVDRNGASAASTIIKVNSNNTDFVIYPNPSIGNEFEIEFNSSQTNAIITIQNAGGFQVYSTTTGEDSFLSGQELPTLQPGIYFITVSNESSSINKKIIIK